MKAEEFWECVITNFLLFEYEARERGAVFLKVSNSKVAAGLFKKHITGYKNSVY